MSAIQNTLLGVPLPTESKEIVLEHIKKYIGHTVECVQVVSLNPEILVETTQNQAFKKVVTAAKIRIIDGVGIVLAARILGVPVGKRFTGVELMERLIAYAIETKRAVALIGGSGNLAMRLADCYNQKSQSDLFLGIEGYKDLKNSSPEEEKALVSIVAARAPQIVLAAFGSPQTELWIDRHSNLFKGCVVASVGGAFAYLAGEVRRPPNIVQMAGLEWLYRLAKQPWRFRRQLRLFKFLWLVLKQRFGYNLAHSS